MSSIPGEKTHVRVAPQLFHDIVKKAHMRTSNPVPEFWKISSKNGNLTSNPSEWLFRFHQNEVLYESYFEIFSGFGNEIIFSDRVSEPKKLSSVPLDKTDLELRKLGTDQDCGKNKNSNILLLYHKY